MKIILEMANNHMGDVDHGKKIIEAFSNVCSQFNDYRFYIKFQYRHLETFIHPDFQDRYDLKYVKRFKETYLTEIQFLELKKHAEKNNFGTVCTPFDEVSVDKVIKHKFDYLKIASCSFSDWPLLEKVSESNLPVIASCAGANWNEIDSFVNFANDKNINFSLLHCVSEYPTKLENHQLIDLHKIQDRYRRVDVGFSSHENPDNIENVQMAYALGAKIFEKHVGLQTDNYSLNQYSVNPTQFEKWLLALERAKKVIGDKESLERKFTDSAQDSIKSLRRYVFSNTEIEAKTEFKKSNMFFALPGDKSTLSTSELNHLSLLKPKTNLKTNDPVEVEKIERIYSESSLCQHYISEIQTFLKQHDVNIPLDIKAELSCHYGIRKFKDNGCALLTFFNDHFCRKYIVMLPGQSHPEQFHKKKEEFFRVLKGDLILKLDDEELKLSENNTVLIKPNQRHSFRTLSGVVIEEISTTHYKEDSYYTDENVLEDRKRAFTLF